jgi:hypothetical protein
LIWYYIKSYFVLAISLLMFFLMPLIEYWHDDYIVTWGNIFFALMMLYLTLRLFRDNHHGNIERN